MGLGFSAVRSYLPVEYFVEKPPELLAVADQLAQSCEAQGIVRFRDPESEIASLTVSRNIVGALYAPTGGIVCPFGLNIALAENAAENG